MCQLRVIDPQLNGHGFKTHVPTGGMEFVLKKTVDAIELKQGFGGTGDGEVFVGVDFLQVAVLLLTTL